MAKKKKLTKAYLSRKNSLQDFKRTPLGLLYYMYYNMRSRTKGTATADPSKYLGLFCPLREDFISWSIDDAEFRRLFERWTEGGWYTCDVPSIDRIDTKRGYELDNLRFVTRSENSSFAVNEYWRKRKAS